MSAPKIGFISLGCPKALVDSELILTELRTNGYDIVRSYQDADMVVVNTCAVTKEATKKSRKLMNRLHRENPQSKVVVSGCYATLEEQQVAMRSGVDLVINNADKEQLPQKVMDAFSDNTMPLNAMEPDQSTLFLRGKQRAFIKIQDGCRYRCTFCIVTVARGAERSRSLEDIVSEVNKLHQQGIQEIVLTGVHVGGYGSDIDSSLYQLVQTLLNDTDMPRIRFASVEPWDLPEEFFALFENKRLMPHMHLPLQSGADSVLRRMSRRCKINDFSSLVEQARSAIPDFNVTTDIIVGFPGETDEEWNQTIKNSELIGFGHIHIFSYSPREGTKAARLDNHVEEAVKKFRSNQLHALADTLKQQFHEKLLNKKVDILWEGQKKNENGRLIFTGYTPNFCKVESNGENDVLLEGRVKKTHLLNYSLDRSVLKGKVL